MLTSIFCELKVNGRYAKIESGITNEQKKNFSGNLVKINYETEAFTKWKIKMYNLVGLYPCL